MMVNSTFEAQFKKKLSSSKAELEKVLLIKKSIEAS